MKILIHQTDNIMLSGLFNAIKDVVQCTIWNLSGSIFDILDRQPKPDLFICDSSLLRSSTLEAIIEYDVPTVIFGFLPQEFIQLKLQIIPSTINRKIVENVKSNYYLMNYAANLIKEHPIYSPSNIVIYNTDKEPKRLMDYIKVLQENNTQFKIVGNKVDIPEYVGEVTLPEIVGLCKTAKINILTGPEYEHDIEINGGLILSLPSDNLLEIIKYWENNPKDIEKAIKLVYKKTIKEHTYYHRAHDIFNLLGYKEEAEKCLLKVSEF